MTALAATAGTLVAFWALTVAWALTSWARFCRRDTPTVPRQTAQHIYDWADELDHRDVDLWCAQLRHPDADDRIHREAAR